MREPVELRSTGQPTAAVYYTWFFSGEVKIPTSRKRPEKWGHPLDPFSVGDAPSDAVGADHW